MFKRAGRKIKGLAIFFFVIQVIFAVVLGVGAIVMGSQMNGGTDYLLFGMRVSGSVGMYMVIGGIVVIVLGILSAWFSTLFIYGYGQLIDRVDDIGEALGKGGRQKASTPVVPAPAPAPAPAVAAYVPPVQAAPKVEPAPEPKPEPKTEPVFEPVTAAVPATVTCPNCGAAVGANMKFCPKCGTSMKG